VIHNGVDSRRFHPDVDDRARVRGELGITQEEFCIGCVGNLLPVKNQLTLLESLAGLTGIDRNWRLLLIGEGAERPKLEAFVDAHPEWRQQVLFLGSTSHVPELLRAMDVFVLPSVAEGISNALLEAMASGLPVIATSVGGNPEVVVDRESGLLFSPHDANALAQHLREVRANRDLRFQLGRRALERVREKFSIDSMVQRYADLYSSTRVAVSSPARAAVTF
jgi:glycosyltransferase involved in cell wall biosynthesis